MAENILNVELLLAVIATLSGLQIIIFGYFARKYIAKIDNNESTMTKIKTEHCIFHKNETGIK